MFTGIISNVGIIKKIDLKEKNLIEINADFINKIKIGESIACSGICLTVFKKNRERWHETLQKDIYMEEALNVLTDLTLNPKGDGFTALKE